MSSAMAMPRPTLHLGTPRLSRHHVNPIAAGVVGVHSTHTSGGVSRRFVGVRASFSSSGIRDCSGQDGSCDVLGMARDRCEASREAGVLVEGSWGFRNEGEARFSRRLVLHMPVVLGGIGERALAEEASSSAPSITKKVFMDVAIEGQPIGQIVIGLYGDTVPIGAQRFAELIAGKRGVGYRRKEFHKIAKNYIQNVGVRGFSLTGGTEDAVKFTGGDTADMLVDEMVKLDELRRRPKHARGSVSLVALDPTRPPPKSKLVAKDGAFVMVEEQVRPPPNGTEFMIAIADAPELDPTNVVVGQVIQGMDVLDRIHNVKVVNENTSSPYFKVAKLIGDSRAVVAEKGFNRPYEKVLISKCGEIR